MKTLLTIIVALVFIVPSLAQEELLPAYPKEISYRSGIAFFNGSPFTGLLVDEKLNKPMGEFRNGYRNGTFTEYYIDGKKKIEANYITGIKDGVETEWYENGQKSREVKIIKGLPNGVLREWHSNGGLKTEISFSNGKIVDGEYMILDEKGLVIESKLYKNKLLVEKKYSNRKYEQFHESGDLKYECYLNEYGNQDGAFTEWWPIGSKKSEGMKNNGILNGKLTTWDENSFKTSEQYYKNGKKDSTSVFWQKNGVTITKYFKDDLLIREEIANPANLISNNSLKKNEYLFYYLEETRKEKIFVKVKIIDNAIESDIMKRQMVSNLLSSIHERLVMVRDKSPYNDEYISFIVELFELKYFAEGKYDRDANKTMYTGNSSYRIRLYNDQNKIVNEDKFNSNNKKSLFVSSFGEKDRALKQGVKKVDCESYMYKYFPIKSEIIEITSSKGDKAKMVKIIAGEELGVKKGIDFNIFSKISSKSPVVGELKVTEVYPTYSLCRVTSGEEAVLSNFNSSNKLIIVSKF